MFELTCSGFDLTTGSSNNKPKAAGQEVVGKNVVSYLRAAVRLRK
ncbi:MULTISPECIES: hypothetical protein [unclassified Bradyrhizobium]|nr:hypothetical protein [Bradyrhizobium sp. USDA 4541]MCP1854520.1 hypothetical protein [Bradyrhizobium sp. USDA 4541]